MNILLVDDQKLFLKSMVPLIRQHIPGSSVFQAIGGALAIEMLDEVNPDIILLDVNMPKMNGLEVAEYINKEYPNIKIVMLTNVDGDAMILSLVKFVDGFLLKDIDEVEFKKCISIVMTGQKYFCKDVQEIIFDNMKTMDKVPYVHFDKRELELIRLLTESKTSKEIAKDWDVKEKTVNSYREGLMKKTKTKNTTGLVAYAFYNGLI